jgi:ADP-heptose:LPS heptosyltransferase
MKNAPPTGTACHRKAALIAKLKRMPSPRFLILLPRQLGDVILGLPLIQQIRAHYPNAHIGWIAHPMARDALARQPGLDRVYFLPKRRKPKQRGMLSSLMCFIESLGDELRFFRDVRRFRANVVVDSMNNPRTAFLAAASGASDRISFRTRFIRNLAFNHLVDRKALSSGYLGATRLLLLNPIGADPDPGGPLSSFTPRLFPGETEREKIDAVLAALPASGTTQGFVAICPPHRRAVRQWTPQGFLSVARHVAMVRQQHVVWLWGPGEYEAVFSLHRQLELTLSDAGLDPKLSYCVPLLSIAETAELCRRASCWIGNSSGLSHVAVAAGCRTVEIHGPTAPEPWTHPDRTRHLFVTRGVGCLACEQNTCRQPRRECLDDLMPEHVISALENLLGANPTAGDTQGAEAPIHPTTARAPQSELSLPENHLSSKGY